MLNGRYPGSGVNDGDTLLTIDSAQVWNELQAFLSENSQSVENFPGLSENHASEVTRFGVINQFHNTCSFMGGVASQEVIKIITHQWIPANNTFIYNGIAGNAQTLQF